MIGDLLAASDLGGGGAAVGTALLARLARASLAGGLFAASVWCLVRALKRLPAAWSCALWWAASLKLVLVLAWVAPVELALLPPQAPAGREEAARLSTSSQTAAAVGSLPGAAAAQAPVVRPGSQSAGPVRSFPWRPAMATIWLLGASVGAVRIGRELRAVRSLRRESRPATDPELLAAFEKLRERLAVRSPVELRLADGIASPLTIGLTRPAVLLPAQASRDLPAAELSLALAHELLHVRRRDLWAGWVPEIARKLFFFHPLAALAAREYHLAREAACDAAVVRELGAAPRAYGRLLLLWGDSARSRGAAGGALPGAFPGGLPGIGAAAAASSSYLDLKRRLVMLQEPTSIPRGLKALGWAAALCAVAALVPLRIVAEPPAPPEPPAAPEAPASPEVPRAPEPPATQYARAAALPPNAPAAPETPVAPRAPRAPAERGTHTSGSVWFDDGTGRNAWALLEGDSNVWMHGSGEDVRRLKQLRGSSGETLVWFRREGEEYVVRDAATIARVKQILEPQRELGRRQGELGRQQGELGRQQGELGRQQGELGRQQGELGRKQGELGGQQARLAAEQAALAAEHAALVARRVADRAAGESDESRARSADLEARRAELAARRDELSVRMRELGERQRELGVPQAELGRQQAELGVPQAELGERQAELGARQAELGARQAELGERQREAAELAEPLLRELFDRAIESGLAEPVR